MEVSINYNSEINSYCVIDNTGMRLSRWFADRKNAEEWAISFMEFCAVDSSKICKVYGIKGGKDILDRLFIYDKEMR